MSGRMFMARDQYGQTFHGLRHPRKDLLRILDKKHASKMYRDTQDGASVHVGYVIAGLWLDVYEVRPFHEPRQSGANKVPVGAA